MNYDQNKKIGENLNKTKHQLDMAETELGKLLEGLARKGLIDDFIYELQRSMESSDVHEKMFAMFAFSGFMRLTIERHELNQLNESGGGVE